MDHIADQEHGKSGAFTCDLRELEELLNRMETKDLLDLTMRRTRWICDSLVLGSHAFCSEMIRKFKLQPGKLFGPDPYNIGNGLYNSHCRAGPFLD